MVFGYFLPNQTKKNVVSVTPSLTKLSGSAHVVVMDKWYLIRIMGFYQLRLIGIGTDLESQLKT